MALFGSDYDNTYANNWSDRSYWSRSGRPMRSNAPRDFNRPRYGSEYYGSDDYRTRGRRPRGWGTDAYTGRDYGEDYRGTGFDRRRDYDRGYKSRQQTDYGDPFGDREQQTPIRMIRGRPRFYDEGYRGGAFYDQEYRNRGSYDQDFEGAYPWGYRPYELRTGYNPGFDLDTWRSSGRANHGYI